MHKYLPILLCLFGVGYGDRPSADPSLPQFSADLVLKDVRAKLYVGNDELRLDVPKRDRYPAFVLLYSGGGYTTLFSKLKEGEALDRETQTAVTNLFTLVLAYRPEAKDYCDGYPRFLERIAAPQYFSKERINRIRTVLKCEKLGEEVSGAEQVEKFKLTLPVDLGGVIEVKYVPVRRFAIFVEGSLSLGLENVKFEPQPKKRFEMVELLKH